ncbi:MAG TPA: pyridoxine 5'-phosphate synthase [bacterium]|nr:pyridoxine 5'-phosphate synthase [bacterium]
MNSKVFHQIKLGVNIDHIATLRQARGGNEPEPASAAAIAELNGADGITIHLREDRRHIQDRDLNILRQTIQTSLNLEMADNDEIINIALNVKPDQITLVPEKRKELTTEGGLDVISNKKKLKETVKKFTDAGIASSLFIDPDKNQIETSKEICATHIEIHTGSYANSSKQTRESELKKIFDSASYADNLGLVVNAGHGLNYNNVTGLLLFKKWNEFNIGHSIISRAVLIGLDNAVKDMKNLLIRY